jgi:hypothetical protein
VAGLLKANGGLADASSHSLYDSVLLLSPEPVLSHTFAFD